MTIGPEPMSRIFRRSVRLGMVGSRSVIGTPRAALPAQGVALPTSYRKRAALQETRRRLAWRAPRLVLRRGERQVGPWKLLFGTRTAAGITGALRALTSG